MQIKTLLGLIFVVLVMSGCTSLSRTEYVTDVDFGQYRTFVWAPHDEHKVDNPILDSDITDERIRAAVVSALTGMGYEASEAPAGFTVTFHTATTHRLRSVGYAVGLGHPGYHGYWRHSIHYAAPDIQSYEDASIVIDIIDSADDRLVWRGWDNARLSQHNFSEARINERVTKILASFPPTN